MVRRRERGCDDSDRRDESPAWDRQALFLLPCWLLPSSLAGSNRMSG